MTTVGLSLKRNIDNWWLISIHIVISFIFEKLVLLKTLGLQSWLRTLYCRVCILHAMLLITFRFDCWKPIEETSLLDRLRVWLTTGI
jgi:hypothetical protein